MDPVHDRGSMDQVHESGPWNRSKVGVHGPTGEDKIIKIIVGAVQRDVSRKTDFLLPSPLSQHLKQQECLLRSSLSDLTSY